MINDGVSINMLSTEVKINRLHKDDYISITDIARFKDKKRTDYIIQNWLRNRNTIEFLGIWEHLNNPDFNPIEFDGIRNSNNGEYTLITVSNSRRLERKYHEKEF